MAESFCFAMSAPSKLSAFWTAVMYSWVSWGNEPGFDVNETVMSALIAVSLASALARFPFEMGLLLALPQPPSASPAATTSAIPARGETVRFTLRKSAENGDSFRLDDLASAAAIRRSTRT